MSEKERSDNFESIAQDGMVARTARMLTKDDKITPDVYRNVVKRFREYIARNGLTQADVAPQLPFKAGTLSSVLNGNYSAKTEGHIRAINNWIETDSRRKNIIRNREFVTTSVAKEIITVAELVSETCTMGVIYGPARIGKTFTFKNIEGADRLGRPVYLRVGKDHRTPHALCRMICRKFDIKSTGTLDTMTERLVKHLTGTFRMLMFDEADKCTYDMLEYIRDLHDNTECPVLFAGKPVVYDKFGFRELGDFKEVTDQLAGRVCIRRDLTERTRTTHRPDGKRITARDRMLFSRADIEKLITTAKLNFKFKPDAIDWLQVRASIIGAGGIGKIKTLIYLACKVAHAEGAAFITCDLLRQCEAHTIGGEAQTKLTDETTSTEIRKLA